jgi:hypothetical protein
MSNFAEHSSSWKKQLEPRNTRTTRKQNGLEKTTDSPDKGKALFEQLQFFSRIRRFSRFELTDLRSRFFAVFDGIPEREPSSTLKIQSSL